jgi:hypothetical protein
METFAILLKNLEICQFEDCDVTQKFISSVFCSVSSNVQQKFGSSSLTVGGTDLLTYTVEPLITDTAGEFRFYPL